MKAIETVWRGYRFRSRLEARWAVWLQSIGARWEYEKEGFDLDGERYLPDFWIPFSPARVYAAGFPPVAGYWLEIKPLPLNKRESDVLIKLAHGSRHHAFAFVGNPWPGEFAIYGASPHDPVKIPSILLPTMCVSCRGLGQYRSLEKQTWLNTEIEVPCLAPCHNCDGTGRSPNNEFWLQCALYGFLENVAPERSTLDLVDHFRAARSARFEHGESTEV